jgi:hypothetical protein
MTLGRAFIAKIGLAFARAELLIGRSLAAAVGVKAFHIAILLFKRVNGCAGKR